jgi:hypothetical protein
VDPIAHGHAAPDGHTDVHLDANADAHQHAAPHRNQHPHADAHRNLLATAPTNGHPAAAATAAYGDADALALRL